MTDYHEHMAYVAFPHRTHTSDAVWVSSASTTWMTDGNVWSTYLLSGSSFIRHQAATCWTWTVWYPRIKIALPSISWRVDSISLSSTLLSVILTKSKHTYIPEVGLIRNPMIRFYHNASLSTVTKTCRKCTNAGIRLLSAAQWLNGIKLALTCNRFLTIQQVSVTNSQKSHALLST